MYVRINWHCQKLNPPPFSPPSALRGGKTSFCTTGLYCEVRVNCQVLFISRPEVKDSQTWVQSTEPYRLIWFSCPSVIPSQSIEYCFCLSIVLKYTLTFVYVHSILSFHSLHDTPTETEDSKYPDAETFHKILLPLGGSGVWIFWVDERELGGGGVKGWMWIGRCGFLSYACVV